MTREKAIALLNNLRAFAEDDDEPAIDMAIEVLQKEIERQERVIRASERFLGLVRCKDCRWWGGDLETIHNNHLCHNWSKFGSINTGADDFCSHGERREP